MKAARRLRVRPHGSSNGSYPSLLGAVRLYSLWCAAGRLVWWAVLALAGLTAFVVGATVWRLF